MFFYVLNIFRANAPNNSKAFQDTAAISYPLKTSENQKLSDVFRGYGSSCRVLESIQIHASIGTKWIHKTSKHVTTSTWLKSNNQKTPIQNPTKKFRWYIHFSQILNVVMNLKNKNFTKFRFFEIQGSTITITLTMWSRARAKTLGYVAYVSRYQKRRVPDLAPFTKQLSKQFFLRSFLFK